MFMAFRGGGTSREAVKLVTFYVKDRRGNQSICSGRKQLMFPRLTLFLLP